MEDPPGKVGQQSPDLQALLPGETLNHPESNCPADDRAEKGGICMARRSPTKGHCYICGRQTTKGPMLNHILKAHREKQEKGGAMILKVEGAYAGNYWLLLEMRADDTLESLDSFLRSIWLECCGHLSCFYVGREELPMGMRLNRLHVGQVLQHDYDFGSTTTCVITVMARVADVGLTDVHLMARNDPEEFFCRVCGAPATLINQYMPDTDNPFFCDACLEAYQEENGEQFVTTVTNSPRMGVCGYCGEYDCYDYAGPEDPPKITRGKKKAATTREDT